METVHCDLCGLDAPTLFLKIPDYLLDRPQIVSTLVRCANCGLIYQNPRPSLAEIGAHYPEEYDSYNSEASIGGSALRHRAVRYGLRKRVAFVTRFLPGGRVLDLGCATGLFLNEMLSAPGWDGMGVEINGGAADAARRQYNLDVFTGTLEQASLPSGSFDAVTMWDVFEHLHSPRETLDEVHRLLKPGGLLVIRVPNYDGWDSKIFADVWAGLDQPRHLYVFDRRRIHQMLEAQGFKILETSSKIGSYPTVVLSIRFWMVKRGVNPRHRDRILGLLYHPIARAVSVPLFYLGSLGSRGPLLVVVAEKVSHA